MSQGHKISKPSLCQSWLMHQHVEHFEKVTSGNSIQECPNEEWNTAPHHVGVPFTGLSKCWHLTSIQIHSLSNIFQYLVSWYYDPFFCQTWPPWRNKQPNNPTKQSPIHSHISLMSLAEILQEYEAKYSTSLNSTTLEPSWTIFFGMLVEHLLIHP